MGIIGERIRELREQRKYHEGKKLTGAELSRIMGITQAYQSSIESGKREPSRELLNQYAAFFNVSADYLLGNTSTPAPQPAASPANVGEAPTPNGGKILRSDKLLMIPHISPEVRVSAGTGNAYEDIQWEVIERYPVFDGPLSAMYGDDDLTCITVEGDSMEPQIHDGDIVVFNHCSDWLSGNIYVVCHNGRLLVKGLVSDGIDKPPILRSVNKEYPDIKIKDDDFFLVYGRVLRIETSRKPKPVI